MKLALCQMAMSEEENENLERGLAALRQAAGQQKMVHIAQACQFCEQDYYTPGDEGFQVFDTPHGRVGVVVCFDRHRGPDGLFRAVHRHGRQRRHRDPGRQRRGAAVRPGGHGGIGPDTRRPALHPAAAERMLSISAEKETAGAVSFLFSGGGG